MKFTTSAAYRAKYSQKNETKTDRLPKLSDFVTATATCPSNAGMDNLDGWTQVRSKRSHPKATLHLHTQRGTPTQTPKRTAKVTPAKMTFPSLGRSCTGNSATPKKAYLTGWSKVAATSKEDFIATEEAELDAMRKEAEQLRAQIKMAKATMPKVEMKKESKEMEETNTDFFFNDFDGGMAWGDMVEEEMGMM